MAGETTTTKKTTAPAGSKSSDAENQAGAPGAAGQAAEGTGSQAAGPDGVAGQAGAQSPDGNAPQVGATSVPAPMPAVAPSVANRRAVAVEVISRRDGFWRGDRQWTHAPQTVPLDELTEQQLDDILDEPLLITRMIYSD